MARISKVYETTDEEFQQIIASTSSFTDACRKIGLSINGSNGREQIKKRCLELNFSFEHFSSPKKDWTSHPKYDLEEILVENSTYKSISRLKMRLINSGLLEYKCEICGNEGKWNGKPLVLQLDHKNGKHNDHRLDNLRFLCPNCHSQTETYAGKNKTTSS